MNLQWTYGWDGADNVFFIPEIPVPSQSSPHGLSLAREEDARLIASAPRLERENAALREAMTRIEQLPNLLTGSDWDEIEEARTIARTALNAAKGLGER